MKHLSIQKTVDAYPKLTGIQRQRLFDFENQMYLPIDKIEYSTKSLAELAKAINEKK